MVLKKSAKPEEEKVADTEEVPAVTDKEVDSAPETAREENEVEHEEKMEKVKEAVDEAADAKTPNLPAAQPTGGLPMKSGKMAFALEEVRDGFVPDYGTLDRLKAGQGDIIDQDDNSLGKFVEIEVYSFNSRFTISPNDKDAEDDLVRFSLDNKVLDNDPSVTVADYLEELKKDWPKAQSKEYFEVVGPLLNADESDTDLMDLVVQLQLSPTSRKSFENYRTQMTFKIARGKATPEDSKFIKFTATPKSGKGNKWTMFKASQGNARE